jgi:hypothetical protein
MERHTAPTPRPKRQRRKTDLGAPSVSQFDATNTQTKTGARRLMRFRALIPFYLNGRYFEASDIIDAANGDIPPGWTPTIGGVDPLDADAIAAYWAVGPGTTGGLDAEFRVVLPYNRYSYTVQNPAVRWVRTGVAGQFILTGAGASLGPRGAHP